MVSIPKRSSYVFNKFFAEKINGGTILIVSAIVAVALANSPWADAFLGFWRNELVIQLGDLHLFSHQGHPMTLLEFINDALMAVFFFSVGLEIKREALVGELCSFKQAMFPIVAAVGGMLIPVLFFVLLAPAGEASQGMAIPMATDIAFSLGILALFGKRVPLSLKIFLTTLAVADDIGGIVVIAGFYSTHISVKFLLISLLILSVIYIGGVRYKIASKMFYVVLGFIFWSVFIESGVHPSIAGVLIALAVPARPKYKVSAYLETIRASVNRFPRRQIEEKKKIILNHDQVDTLKVIESASDKVISPLQHFEDNLHPIINYFVMPLFALANAGVVINASELSGLVTGLPMAIVVGLVAGKFVGIFSFSYLFDRFGWINKSAETSWKQIAAVSMVAGIGFTVSLFIATLAYGFDSPFLNQAKMGIVFGSLLAGGLGYVLLDKFLPKNAAESEPNGEDDCG